jgi:hypothetical protein
MTMENAGVGVKLRRHLELTTVYFIAAVWFLRKHEKLETKLEFLTFYNRNVRICRHLCT